MSTASRFSFGPPAPSNAQIRTWSFEPQLKGGNPPGLWHPMRSQLPFPFRSASTGHSMVGSAANASSSSAVKLSTQPVPSPLGPLSGSREASSSARTLSDGSVPTTRRTTVPVGNTVEPSFQAMLDAFNSLRISPEPYECGICLETKTDDVDLALVFGCKHKFCLECLREFVCQQISDRKYPVICPLCMVSESSKGRTPSELNSVYVAQLGLSPEQYDAFVDLELTPHAEKVCCPWCGVKALVEKGGLTGKMFMKCFFNGCNTMWCRGCNKIVADTERRAHLASCDNGSKETAALAQKSGWKKCPGCSVLIERTTGCNHITCRIPTCNTHFCYKCGKTIVQSRNKEDIRAAKKRHYRLCTLYDDPPRLPPQEARYPPMHPRAQQVALQWRAQIDAGRGH